MNPNLDRVIILADESANWKIGGLLQLERLALALNELATSISSQRRIDIFIFWREDIPADQRWRPENPRLNRCNFVDTLVVGSRERVFNTRLFVKRRGLEQFVQDSIPLENDATISDESAVWQKLWQRFETTCAHADQQNSEKWQYLASGHEIAGAERWLLRGSGKTRDGFVSRHLNRPASRAVSRLLLKTPMTPNFWTWLITVFPLIGFLLVMRGDYFGFVTGALLFNVQSILDGCDGEIARAKYLDSEQGPGIDAFGDLITLLLFSLGLGFGLSHAAGSRLGSWIFVSEGVLTSIFLAVRLVPDHVLDLLRRGQAAVVSTQNDQRLGRSSGRVFGDRFTAWAFELTKRDVVFLAFLILAALGLALWTLHLLFVYALTTLILSSHGRR